MAAKIRIIREDDVAKLQDEVDQFLSDKNLALSEVKLVELEESDKAITVLIVYEGNQ